MAYINRRRNKNEYPYQGTFYTKGEPTLGGDGDMFGDEAGSVEDVIVLETKCDVTETNRAFASGAITASYDVFFPISKGDTVTIKRGQMFNADVNGINVIGMVISVGYSQLGGVHAYIKSTEI